MMLLRAHPCPKVGQERESTLCSACHTLSLMQGCFTQKGVPFLNTKASLFTEICVFTVVSIQMRSLFPFNTKGLCGPADKSQCNIPEILHTSSGQNGAVKLSKQVYFLTSFIYSIEKDNCGSAMGRGQCLEHREYTHYILCNFQEL